MGESAHYGWIWRKVRRAIQVYGWSWMKRLLWNREFQMGKWNALIETPEDPVYPVIAKHCAKQSILDLGCSSGSTANDLDSGSYSDYVGVDISDAAVKLAAKRVAKNGRAAKAQFLQGDIETYVPGGQYRVILFRESIYYVPEGRLIGVLDHYRNHLDSHGVFVVRIYNACKKLKAVMRLIEENFQIVEKHRFENPWATVVVFR